MNDWPEKLKQYTEEALATMADASDREPYTFAAAVSIMADVYALTPIKIAMLAQAIHKSILAETMRQMLGMIHELEAALDHLENTVMALEEQQHDPVIDPLPRWLDDDPADAQRKGY